MPVTRNRHEAGQPSIVPSPQLSDNQRPTLKKRDIGVGCIVWLPSKNANSQGIKCIRESCSKQELQEGGYNHPVVILKATPTYFDDVDCSIAMITSKKGRGYDRVKISQEQQTLQPDATNHGEIELYLENNIMNKQSYVLLDHIFEVLGSQLRTCSFHGGSRAYDSRLCEQSYALLVAKLDFKPENWVKTVDLAPRNASRRETQSRRQSLAQPQTSVTNLNPARQNSRAHQLESSVNSSLPARYSLDDRIRLLPDSTLRTMPGMWQAEAPSRDQYYTINRGGRRIEQIGDGPPNGDNNHASKIFFKGLVVLLSVGSFAWWIYQIK